MTPESSGAGLRTTLLGGSGLIVAGVLWILADEGSWFPHVVTAAVWGVVADLILCAAAVVLAVGLSRETGIVGRSGWGVTTLILFGARNLVLWGFGRISVALFTGAGSVSTAVIVTSAVLTIGFAVATLVAGIGVARAGVLRGFARCPLLAVGCCYLLAAAFSFTDLVPADRILGVLAPLLVIVTGTSYALHGRSARVRSRARAFNEQW